MGNDKQNSNLWWFLIPVVLREACEEARRLNGKAVRIDFPLRKDGGSGWIFADEIENECPQYFSGCNGYFKDNSILTYYWSINYFNQEISDYLKKLEDVKSLKNTAEISGIDEFLIAQGLKYNIIKKSGYDYKWEICVFTDKQIKELDVLKVEIAKPLSRKLLEAVNKVYDLYLCDTPKHLHDQIRGAFGAEFNIIIDMICRSLEEERKLEKPQSEYFSKQIVMTIKA